MLHSGSGVVTFACGRYNVLLPVLPVGMNELDTSAKISEGCNSKPSMGSSSVPVETAIHDPA